MEAPKPTQLKRPVLSRAAALHPPASPEVPSTISVDSAESKEPIMSTPDAKDDVRKIEVLNNAAKEEAGEATKQSSAGEDPFGDEEGAGIKYKTMTWW